MTLKGGGKVAWALPHDCPQCDEPSAGQIQYSGLHVKLTCASCGGYVTFISKAEVGLTTRSVSSRPATKPSVRINVFQADRYCCWICSRPSVPNRELVIGHIVSVKDAEAASWTEKKIYAEENLVSLCEECNSGLGSRSIDPDLVVRIRAMRWAQA